MPERTKRTYNLAPSTVQVVRELVDEYGVASSQDAVIELAVEELERRVRDDREGEAWAAAADDPEFLSETAGISVAYRSADGETWPR